jgi:hypothetical protein
VIAALQENTWVVFDAAPNYMFHYVTPKGIVGIYMGSSPSFDFRDLLKDRNLRIGEYHALEYRIEAGDSIGACSS